MFGCFQLPPVSRHATAPSDSSNALYSGHGIFVVCHSSRREPLHAPSPIGLRHVEVAAGIHRHRVTVDEISELMPGPSEARQDLPALPIENVNTFVPSVHH